MPSVIHIAETSLLVLAAYLVGCTIGYAVHRILYAARGTRQVGAVATPAVPPPAAQIQRPRRAMSPAARLAAAVSDDPLPRPARADRAPLPSQPRPAAMARPRASGADNLKQIKGIGPKIEASLNGLGVFHLEQIAAWSPANVEWIDHHLALKGRISREHWVEQARAMLEVTRLSA